MKLAFSNIAWEEKNDFIVYDILKKNGVKGLEIAPTRIFLQRPYENLEKAKEWKDRLQEKYGFEIPSMQSIWYGRQENMFDNAEDRKCLIEYTKKAIDFAAVIECKNLVFGCPKNRNVSEKSNKNCEIDFFREIGEYALYKGTVIGMEANPTIYNTNYINYTKEALDLIERVGSEGFKLNLDVGTMIYNKECIKELTGSVKMINHVHISEPELKVVKERGLHNELKSLLKHENYDGYISVEMAKVEHVSIIEEVMKYLRGVFNA